ncbi:MAG: exonuclease SbcCD subunit D [Pseudomonadota bacterium]
MKILHTADLHLGRRFLGLDLHDDQQHVLDQILVAVATHRPDCLIIAGDVFDAAAPREPAVRQFNGFLRALKAESDAALVVIAGNHDSSERIDAMATLADPRWDLVRGPLAATEPTLVLRDDAGPVAFSALPFAYPSAAREIFDDPTIAEPADVIRAQVGVARAGVPKGARWVIVAHAFVVGGDSTQSERALSRTVGGVETVPVSVFEGAHYVALGHLHRPQAVGHTHVRYAGSPLAFGFDEEGQQKSMTLVDLAADGTVETARLPITPRRGVRTITGRLQDLLAPTMAPSDDIIDVVLTDPGRLLDPMKQLRARFPNACAIRYAQEPAVSSGPRGGLRPRRTNDAPEDVVAAFLAETDDLAPDEATMAIVRGGFARLLDQGEDAAA